MKTNKLPLMFILMALLCTQAIGKIIYVDDDANGVKNGTSWENAYKYLQDALTDAKYAAKPVEIRVAQGTYRPDMGAGIAQGNRQATFQLISKVNLIGGYAGPGQPDPNVRDIELYETILSGDLNNNDVEGINLFDEPSRRDNCYRIITSNNIDETTSIDGFTITAGNANETICQNGGGLYNYQSNLTVTKCKFIKNSAYKGGGAYNYYNNPNFINCTFDKNLVKDYGGGIYNDNSSPTFTNCTCSENYADSYGGGMYNNTKSNPTLTNCTFNGNSANKNGGGMYNYSNNNPTLTNCTFNGNSAKYGGGIYNYSITATLTNCTFIQNDADTYGGGIYNVSSNLMLTNCTFSRNSSEFNGGGIYNAGGIPTLTNCSFSGNTSESDGGGMYNSNSNPTLTNCIFSGNTSGSDGGGMFNYSNSNPTLTNCTLSKNKADYYGGGIYNASSNPSIEKCLFSENTAGNYGGGVYNDNSKVKLMSCIFSGNKAVSGGGGIDNKASNIAVVNCTFTGNLSQLGNAICCFIDSGNTNNPLLSSIELTNCILWDEDEQIANVDGSRITIAYCDVKGGQSSIYSPDENLIWGAGNIDSDPCFAAAGYWDPNGTANNSNDDFWVEGDYHLKSQAGRFDPNSQSWIIDDVTSPCIDAGDIMAPIGYEQHPNGNIINIGAFGGTIEASKSLYEDINSSLNQAIYPEPLDNAVNVVLDTILSWLSDSNSYAHEVYFGAREYPPFVQKRYESDFFPGALEPNTKYYWRIDDLDNSLNRVTGNIWTFTTGAKPDFAYNPNPRNGEKNVKYETILSWNPGLNANYHNVYFGTNFNDINNAMPWYPPVARVSYFQGPNYYHPSGMEFNMTYYWRIDESTSTRSTTFVKDNIWSFTTGSHPIQAYNPNPADSSISVGPDTLLTWSRGLGAVKHDIYFGTNPYDANEATVDNPLGVLVSAGQEPNFYDPGTLKYNWLYCWRIDEIDSNGITTKGDMWTFTIRQGGKPTRASCFIGQVPVWIDGKTIEISNTSVGQILNQNDSVGGMSAKGHEINQVQEHQGTYDLYDIILESGNCITVADEHYFMSDSGIWISSKTLEAGMKLRTAYGIIGIKSVTKQPENFTGKVYNLDVKRSDRYMVGMDAVIVRDY
jgi:predicted outer membrane repeat protein